MGKKLIRVSFVDGLYDAGSYLPSMDVNTLSFAFVGPGTTDEDGLRRRTQMSRWVTCREQLCYVPWHAHHKSEYSSIFDGTKHQIDFTKLRLLIGSKAYGQSKDEMKSKVFAAKRAMNLIERYAGWEESTISTIKHTDMNNADEMYWLVTGSEKWVKAPQMVSLAGLILRYGRKFGPFNTDDIDSYIEEALAHAETKRHNINDAIYVCDVYPHLKKLVRKYDKVFEGPLAEYYPKDFKKGMGGYGGIQAFVKKQTGNAALHKRFQHHVLNG